MCAYKILLNGVTSVLNTIGGDIADPYSENNREWAFSTGRKAQAFLKAHKKDCVDKGTSLLGCFYTFEKGKFVPYEEE